MKWSYVSYHFLHHYINYHILCNEKAKLSRDNTSSGSATSSPSSPSTTTIGLEKTILSHDMILWQIHTATFALLIKPNPAPFFGMTI
jgi:hypothetical protein